MNATCRNSSWLVFAMAICWTLSGCHTANWQQAGYGPGSVGSGYGSYPAGPPAGIDLGEPAQDAGSLYESPSDLSEPRTFESQRPVIPPARSNPTRDVPGSNVPESENQTSVPRAGRTPVPAAPRSQYVPPLRGPVRLGQPSTSPFPEGRRRPASRPPVARQDDEADNSPSKVSPQPLPLTKKAEPEGSYEFPLRRPEDVLESTPEIASPGEGFDLPPLIKPDSIDTPEDNEAGPALPVLEAPLITSAAPEFSVEAPPLMLVGEASRVTVTIAAPEETKFDNLRVVVSPGTGLVLTSRSNEGALSLDCPKLGSGETHKLTFEVQAVSSGAHELEVTLKSGDEELAWKKLTLTARPRQLMTELTGPARKPVNGRAEFTLKIENVSQEALGPIKAILEFDSTLVPMEASAGAEQQPGQLIWSFPVLHPGELILLQAEYACPVETGSSVVSSYVSIEDGPAQVRQSSVSVKRGSRDLRVELIDRDDLSRVGGELTGIVRVTNRSLQPARELQVRLELPERLELTGHQARMKDETVEVSQEEQDGALLFTFPGELPSEQTAELELRFKTRKAGDGILQVEVSAGRHASSVKASEPFTVTP